MARDQINAFLGAGTHYEGTLSFQGSVRIDGEFIGEIDSEGTLVVGKDARLEGVFKVGELVLSGTINGEVIAAKKAVLNKQSHFFGTLHTPLFVVEEGADMRGRVNMHKEQSPTEGMPQSGEEKNLEQEGDLT
ncbi:bactofilin family protein [Desulfoplanes sp. PS50]|jgi:cytoskeletal protein CcmA (bactofilin family)